MLLHHFTSELHLHGIARHGLTVGDVTTDIHSNSGRVGVWLTSAENGTGHGLEGSAAYKKRFRLSVELPDNAPQLVRWLDWATENATRATITALHDAAPDSRPATWFIYFGVIPISAIRSCFDMLTGEPVLGWTNLPPPPKAMPAVPPWRRAVWHRQLLKKLAKMRRADAGAFR